MNNFNSLDGRGSRIRTCDLKYPKLPRYRAALYPVFARVANMGRRPEQGRLVAELIVRLATSAAAPVISLFWANLFPVIVLFGRTVEYSLKPLTFKVFSLVNSGEKRPILPVFSLLAGSLNPRLPLTSPAG